MLQTILALAQSGQSFAFETTPAGLGYARHIPRWQAAGYHVTLFYLTLPTPEMAIARVAERVRQGGHDVPESVIEDALPWDGKTSSRSIAMRRMPGCSTTTRAMSRDWLIGEKERE